MGPGTTIAIQVALNEPGDPADESVFRLLLGESDRVPYERIPPLLRRAASWIGADPDLDQIGWISGSADFLLPRFRLDSDAGGALEIGAIGGPIAFNVGLGCLGLGARANFLTGHVGPEAVRWADPAFAPATCTLIAGLSLSPVFRNELGLEWPEETQEELLRELALAPRLAWTYVSSGGRPRAPSEAVALELIRRATGRPGSFDELVEFEERDPTSASLLRGAILGLLLEEALKTRFGHRWYRSRAAHGLLREIWEAESGETAESMARTLGLGRIEPTPLLDRFGG